MEVQEKDALVTGTLLSVAPWRLHLVWHQANTSFVGSQAYRIGFKNKWLVCRWGASLREAYFPLGFKNPTGERYLRLVRDYPRVSLKQALTSLPLARAKPPPSKIRIFQGILSFTVFQVRMAGGAFSFPGLSTPQADKGGHQKSIGLPSPPLEAFLSGFLLSGFLVSQVEGSPSVSIPVVSHLCP